MISNCSMPQTPHDTISWSDPHDLNVNGTDGSVLGIIIPRIDQIKKNTAVENLKPEVVGGYRHKRYERCYHGILAFVILEKLQNGLSISFLRKDATPDNKEHWTDIKLFLFQYDAARKAFENARELANVDKWQKSTHFR